MDYVDFALKFEPPRDGEFPVLVLGSPAGQGRGTFRLTADLERPNVLLATGGRADGDERWREVKRSRGSTGILHNARQVGGRLFEELFAGEVRSLFERSLGWIDDRSGTGLRIRLHFDPSDPQIARLCSLPWEILYRSRTQEFLNLDRRTPVVRFLDIPQPGRSVEVEPPIRVLIAGARPPGTRPLNLELERQKIVDSWERMSAAQPRVVFEILDHVTPWTLRAALLDGGFHVLHFMGHGRYLDQTGQGALILGTDDGGAFLAPGPFLGDLLRGLETLHTVVLNACNTARVSPDGTNPFAGVAAALVLKALPAVVAMQSRIADRAAVTFAASFYARLAAGDPIDAAVSEARLEMATQRPGTIEWGTPVLFLRSPGSRMTARTEARAGDRPGEIEPATSSRPGPFMAEEPPADFVDRPEAYDPLIESLLAPQAPGAVALATALLGAGGYGKTTLACAVCHDPRVRTAFADGILWVTLGEQPQGPSGYIEDLIQLLSGKKIGFSTLDAALAHWTELIAERRMLIVVDDVWNRAHLGPFLQGGPGCVRLVTTRDRTTLPAGARVVSVDAMRRQEALDLVTAGLPEGNRRACQRLAARLGHWPLLLRLVNGVLRDRVEHQQRSLAESLIYVFAALERRGLTAFDVRNPSDRHQAVATTLDVSIEQLVPEERIRFGELAIFPEDVDIPLNTLGHLWQPLDDFEVEAICVRFQQLSLLLATDLAQRFIRLHDVVRAYLVQQAGSALASTHARFLDTHRHGEHGSPLAAWREMPTAEAYLLRHLSRHLAAAGRQAELIETVADPGYLATRVDLGDLHGAERDLVVAQSMAPDDRRLARLCATFANAKHVLLRCRGRQEIGATLLSRLDGDAALTATVAEGERGLSGPRLRTRCHLPDAPEPALIRTLAGHAGPINGCALSSEGEQVLSASEDGSIRTWDARAGVELIRLEESSDDRARCALSSDGTVAVTVAEGVVRVWNAARGVERYRLTGDPGSAAGCAVSADGRVAACLWMQGALRVWDLATGDERWHADLVGSLGGCALNGDGSVLLAASGDKLEVWHGLDGHRLAILEGHEKLVRCCALSADGEIALSGSDDGTLRLWSLRNGRELECFESGSEIVSACALSADGKLGVSGDYSSRVRLWDLDGRRWLQTLIGHAGPIEACAVDPRGELAVSGGTDFTLKLWDLGRVATDPAAPFRGHFVDCAWSAGSGRLAVASMDSSVRCWDPREGREIRILERHDMAVSGVALAPDGGTVFSVAQDGSARRWPWGNDRESMSFGPQGPSLHACALNAEGTQLATAARDGKLTIFEVSSREELVILDAGDGVLCACAFSPDGRWIAAASRDHLVRLWDRTSSFDLRTLEGHEDEVNDCAFSPDSAWLVSVSNDQTVRVWSRDGRPLNVLAGHEGPVRGCSISPDGSLVASASADPYGGSITVWKVESGDCLVTVRVDGELDRCR